MHKRKSYEQLEQENQQLLGKITAIKHTTINRIKPELERLRAENAALKASLAIKEQDEFINSLGFLDDGELNFQLDNTNSPFNQPCKKSKHSHKPTY